MMTAPLRFRCVTIGVAPLLVDPGRSLVGPLTISYRHPHDWFRIAGPLAVWGGTLGDWTFEELVVYNGAAADSMVHVRWLWPEEGEERTVGRLLAFGELWSLHRDPTFARPGAAVTVPKARVIPDFPHRCPRCGAPAYVGAWEVTHESYAGSCPARRRD